MCLGMFPFPLFAMFVYSMLAVFIMKTIEVSISMGEKTKPSAYVMRNMLVYTCEEHIWH